MEKEYFELLDDALSQGIYDENKIATMKKMFNMPPSLIAQKQKIESLKTTVASGKPAMSLQEQLAAGRKQAKKVAKQEENKFPLFINGQPVYKLNGKVPDFSVTSGKQVETTLAKAQEIDALYQLQNPSEDIFAVTGDGDNAAKLKECYLYQAKFLDVNPKAYFDFKYKDYQTYKPENVEYLEKEKVTANETERSYLDDLLGLYNAQIQKQELALLSGKFNGARVNLNQLFHQYKVGEPIRTGGGNSDKYKGLIIPWLKKGNPLSEDDARRVEQHINNNINFYKIIRKSDPTTFSKTHISDLRKTVPQDKREYMALLSLIPDSFGDEEKDAWANGIRTAYRNKYITKTTKAPLVADMFTQIGAFSPEDIKNPKEYIKTPSKPMTIPDNFRTPEGQQPLIKQKSYISSVGDYQPDDESDDDESDDDEPNLMDSLLGGFGKRRSKRKSRKSKRRSRKVKRRSKRKSLKVKRRSKRKSLKVKRRSKRKSLKVKRRSKKKKSVKYKFFSI